MSAFLEVTDGRSYTRDQRPCLTYRRQAVTMAFRIYPHKTYAFLMTCTCMIHDRMFGRLATSAARGGVLVDSGDVIERLTYDACRAALVLDFDGVLAPIVQDPGTSVMLDGNPQLLERI